MNVRDPAREPGAQTKLTAEVSLFAESIRKAPPQKLQMSATSEWGAREILIHLVFWHGQYVCIIKNLLEDRQPVLLTGTFKSINEECIAGFSSCSTDELVVSLERLQNELARLAQMEQTNRLCFSLRQGSKKWEFPEFMQAITRHIRKHRLQVRRLIRL